MEIFLSGHGVCADPYIPIQYAGDSVELFIPNEKNLNNAFEGTDIDDSASRCAEQLVREKVLFSKPLGGGNSSMQLTITRMKLM